MQQKLTHNTAVLIFANSAEVDSRTKKISDSKGLFDALTKKIVSTVKDTGLPFFHLGQDDQYGNSFGERFSNAIQQVFELGYSQIITVGNDSPQLCTNHILQAEKGLLAKQTILGPSLDGGFYLMGILRSNFDKEKFEALPWQTTQLYEKALAHFESQRSKILRLSTLVDIDSISDVKLLLGHIKSLGSNWISILTKLLIPEKPFFKNIEGPSQTIHHAIPFNKGSPCFA